MVIVIKSHNELSADLTFLLLCFEALFEISFFFSFSFFGRSVR